MKLTDAKTAKLNGNLPLFPDQPPPVLSHGNETKIGSEAPKVPSQPSETKKGRPSNPVIAKIMRTKKSKRTGKCSRATAYRRLAKQKARKLSLRESMLKEGGEFVRLIKPADSWNFSEVVYDKITDDASGYIPGDLYANALFYWTKPGDLVVAPMAGSGMIQCVYNDRGFWMRPELWDVDLRMFDLTPRGPYRELISQWDLTRGFPPVGRRPNYVIMDVPYFGACRNAYSSKPNDIANMDLHGWTAAMEAIARSCASVQAKLCTIVCPDWVNSDTGEMVLCTEILRDIWRGLGYRLTRKAYASKRIQAARTDRIAVLNNRAKRTRTMLSDMSEVLTFAAP
jgi:hypothetical protein